MLLAEHSSIASFGRVIMELLHFGVSAELLRDVHMASMDEIRHARIISSLYEKLSSLMNSSVTSSDTSTLLNINPPLLYPTLAIKNMKSNVRIRDIHELIKDNYKNAIIGEYQSAKRLEEFKSLLEKQGLQTVSGIFENIATDEYRHAELGHRIHEELQNYLPR